MPTLASSQIPAPSNWQDFETLCRDLWRVLWGDPNAQKHGRHGQPQQGVDAAATRRVSSTCGAHGHDSCRCR